LIRIPIINLAPIPDAQNRDDIKIAISLSLHTDLLYTWSCAVFIGIYIYMYVLYGPNMLLRLAGLITHYKLFIEVIGLHVNSVSHNLVSLFQ